MLLRNLLDNAIKYTPAPARVDVAWTRVDGGILLTVDDSGPGIAPADRERVFDRFFRTDAARGLQPGSGRPQVSRRPASERASCEANSKRPGSG